MRFDYRLKYRKGFPEWERLLLFGLEHPWMLKKRARLEAGFVFSSGGIVLMHRPPDKTE